MKAFELVGVVSTGCDKICESRVNIGGDSGGDISDGGGTGDGRVMYSIFGVLAQAGSQSVIEPSAWPARDLCQYENRRLCPSVT